MVYVAVRHKKPMTRGGNTVKECNFNYEAAFKRLVVAVYGAQRNLAYARQSKQVKESKDLAAVLEEISGILDNITTELDEECIKAFLDV